MRIEEPWDLPRLLVPDGGGGYGYDGCGSFVSDNWASHLGRVWVWVWVWVWCESRREGMGSLGGDSWGEFYTADHIHPCMFI
jgi:hypothetical protein